MSDADFYTFLTGGLGLLIALMTLVAWHLWRMREDARSGRASALEGVAHELRINLQRMVAELSQVATNAGAGPDVLLPIRHPQLDGVNSSLITANRNGIAVLGVTYQELEARKLGLRAVLAQGREPGTTLDDAMDAAANGIAALYIWEVHKGARPKEIGTVRSWSVRDWMKAHGFKADAFPGLHLRDEVVERLRLGGLTLTPRPLTHTAWEYYSMQYDRHADARGPLGRRRIKARAAEAAGEEAGPPKRGGVFGLFGRGKGEAEAAESDDAQTYDAGAVETVAVDPPAPGPAAASPEPAAPEAAGTAAEGETYPAGDQPPRSN